MENLLKTTQLRRTYVIEYAKNTAKMRPKWLIQYNKDWNLLSHCWNIRLVANAKMANPVQQGLKHAWKRDIKHFLHGQNG